jgi:hypothetical protein
MDKYKARFVLQSVRPDGADAEAPEFAEAIEVARTDPGLGSRFAAEQELDRLIASKLACVPVPGGLCDSMLAGAEVSRSVGRHRFVQRLALAASVALLATVAAVWWTNARRAASFASYRQEMVSRLDESIQLSFMSPQADELQQWLAQTRGVTGVEIPAGLRNLPAIGCRTWMWNDRPAGLICFLVDGRHAVHLLVISRAAVPNAPGPAESQVLHVGNWETASWTQGENVYVLAGKLDREALEKLL